MIDLHIPVEEASPIFKLNVDPISITGKESNKRPPYL